MNESPLPIYPDHPELAVVAVLYMLVRQMHDTPPCVAASVRAHLLTIAADARNAAMLREAATRLANVTLPMALTPRPQAPLH